MYEMKTTILLTWSFFLFSAPCNVSMMYYCLLIIKLYHRSFFYVKTAYNGDVPNFGYIFCRVMDQNSNNLSLKIYEFVIRITFDLFSYLAFSSVAKIRLLSKYFCGFASFYFIYQI